MNGVCDCQWPVTMLGMNSEWEQLGIALGYNGERTNPPESSCYLPGATIEGSVRADDEIQSVLREET